MPNNRDYDVRGHGRSYGPHQPSNQQLLPVPQAQSGSTQQQHQHQHGVGKLATQANGSNTRKLCHDYLLDQCTFGSSCRRSHPPSLNAASIQKRVDFQFDTSIGVACERCVKFLLPARVTHGLAPEMISSAQSSLETIPVATIRAMSATTLAEMTGRRAYQAGALIMTPRPKFDYALPTYDRTAQKARGDDGNIPTSPMPSARVRPDWTGKTKSLLSPTGSLRRSAAYPDHIL